MKLTGHTDQQTNLELSEVLLELTAAEARKIGEFLLDTAKRMETMGLDYEHEHLSDHMREFESSPHFVVIGGGWHSDNQESNDKKST